MNTPELRFKEFDEEWEKVHFAKLLEVKSGFAFKLQDYVSEGVILINGEAIQHNQIQTKNINFLPKDFLKKYNEFKLQTNDIVLGLNRPITNNQLKIAKIPAELNNSLLYQRAGKIIYKTDSINKEFFYYLLSKEIFKFVKKEAIGSDQPFISTTKLNSWEFYYPKNCIEQKKISSFLNKLDRKIQLQQEKIDLLKEQKKGLIQKIFNQELRFEGFNDEWKSHTLSHFFEKYQNTIYLEDDTEYVQVSVRNTGTVEFRGLKKGSEIGRKRQYVIDTDNYPNTLTFTRQTIYEGGIGFVPKNLNGAIVTENMPLLAMKSNLDKNFALAFFNTTQYYRNVIERNMPIGSAQKALHEKIWLEGEILVPSIEEQRKIGLVQTKFNNLIELHEKKLILLEQQKQALMQQMFI